MQVITVEDCGVRERTVDVGDGSQRTIRTYYLNGSPNTGIEWNGDASEPDPFSFGPPWDYIFKVYIDKMGTSLIGKQFIFDVDDPDGNVVKVR